MPRRKRTRPDTEPQSRDVFASLDTLLDSLRNQPPVAFSFNVTIDVVDAPHGDHLHRALLTRCGAGGDLELLSVMQIHQEAFQQLVIDFANDVGALLGLDEGMVVTEGWVAPDEAELPSASPPITPTRHRKVGRA